MFVPYGLRVARSVHASVYRASGVTVAVSACIVGCGVFDGTGSGSSSETTAPAPIARPVPTIIPAPIPSLPPVDVPPPAATVDAGIDAAADANVEGGTPSTGPISDAGADAPDTAAPACGDGVINPNEECDDGPNASTTTLCSASCTAQEQLLRSSPDAGTVRRTLGAGRHTIAGANGAFGVVYTQTEPTTALVAQLFDARDVATAPIALTSPSVARSDASPVIAAAAGGYVAAFAVTSIAIDGETDIALQRIGAAGIIGASVLANAGTVGAHAGADVAWTGTDLVVAWTETSRASTSPDVRMRRFDANLIARTVGDEDLGVTSDAEENVALTAFGGAWAAAYRTTTATGEILRVRTPAGTWSVGPYLAGPDTMRPALTPIDATHLLAVYVEGRGDGDAGIATSNVLRGAIVDTSAAQASAIVAFDLTSNGISIAALEANVVRAGANVVIAWRSPAVVADPNGEDLWMATLSNVTSPAGVHTALTPAPVPRAVTHRKGDQRALSLAPVSASPSQIVSAWEDRGSAFGPLEAQPDVAVLRLPPLL
jgi:cysteine-rich repeat protein